MVPSPRDSAIRFTDTICKIDLWNIEIHLTCDELYIWKIICWSWPLDWVFNSVSFFVFKPMIYGWYSERDIGSISMFFDIGCRLISVNNIGFQLEKFNNCAVLIRRIKNFSKMMQSIMIKWICHFYHLIFIRCHVNNFFMTVLQFRFRLWIQFADLEC